MGLCTGAMAQSAPAAAAPSPAASAAQVSSPVAHAGMVKRSVGSATLERQGKVAPAKAGDKVQVGDVLRTGAEGIVGLTLADDTRLVVGPNSELVVSAFNFDSTTNDGNLLASLWRGTLNVITGLIGKKDPEKVKVQTRTVVLGVRGTEFIVDTTGAQP